MTTYWSLSAALEPWCMVLPHSKDELSTVVTTITENQCPFGIRGGGHGTHALSNSLEEGVTIDMGFFNETTYDESTKIASVGPGGHWGDVYDTLTPHGVTVTGGRAGSVGVGGFLLGGGNSFHSGTHGFGCDQVKNFEVVLADGSIVNANEEEHADLWKALKGGSGNFGLVTRYDMYVIEFEDKSKPEIWGGLVGYNYSQTGPVIDAFINFADNVGNDPATSSIMGWGYDPAAGGFSIRCVLDNVANEAYPAALDEFLAIDEQTSSSLRSGTMSNITTELIRDYRTYTIWFTGTYKNDARVLQYISDGHEKVMLEIEELIGTESGMFSSCQAQPMTRSMVSKAKGNNVLGLEERVADGPGFMFLMYFGVEDAENEAAALPLIRQFFQDVEDYANSLDANWNWSYLNYAYYDQEPISGYGAENIEFLKQTSKTYDPEGVFQNLRQSGFKIPE